MASGRVPIVLSRVPVYVHNGLVSTYSLVMLGGAVAVCAVGAEDGVVNGDGKRSRGASSAAKYRLSAFNG